MRNKSVKSVLLIEDNAGDARLLREMFRESGSDNIDLIHVDTMVEAEQHLAATPFDIILLDLGLPDSQGLEAVRRVRIAAPRTPLVVLTGLDDELMAERSLQTGAQDYLIKGEVEPRALMRAMRHAIERSIIEDALFLERGLAQATLNCIGDAVACTDSSGKITFLNIAAEKMTGWLLSEAAGLPLEEVFSIHFTSNRDPALRPLSVSLGQNRTLRLPPNCVLVRRDGVEIPIEDSISAMHDRDGQVNGSVIVFRDVSASRAMAEQIVYSAEHDFLTGLPNRMLLNDRIGHAIGAATSQDTKVALLFLDLDGFKHINDSLGHPAGDKLLKSVADRLLECMREGDTVSRQGGDEFIVLLADPEPGSVIAIAKRLLAAIAVPHSIDDSDLHVTTSIGVSMYPDDGLDAETLIKNADTAMYQAKENGRQNYQFFEPAMSIQAIERQSIEASLRTALQKHEFHLHYQPKINLETGKITGAEALIRWTHPLRGAMAPGQFIPIAEECGLILPISRWVLREACRQTQAWVAAGLPPITIAVNVSAIDFQDETFLESVFAILEDTGLDPRLLELELTEGVLMKRADETESMLKQLKACGVRISVDDFGTGYSSLSYLSKFSIDALKIDQSFIRQISLTPAGATIVHAMISMGRSLKLCVIAEGVETREEMALLQQQGCDEAQGFYFSKAVVPETLAQMLAIGNFSVS